MKAAASSASEPAQVRGTTPWLICLLLAAITFSVFSPVAHCGFINYDDPEYVVKNPNIQEGLSAKSVKWALTSNHASNWHPVTWLSHMLDWKFYGNNASGHHLTNVAIHIANVLLFFGLLRKTTGAVWRSAIAAALFALHPLHVESVAWISERKDVLSTFFGLLSIFLYVRHVETAGEKAGKRESGRPLTFSLSHFPTFYSLSLLFFALSLMSKPMLVTLPFVLLLLDFWPLRRVQSLKFNVQGSTHAANRPTLNFEPRTLNRLLIEKLPYLALSIASSIITVWAQKAGGALRSAQETPLLFRIENALTAYLGYLQKTIWPTKLAVFYPLPTSLPQWKVILAAAVLLAVSWFAVRRRHTMPFLFTGWFWFLGTLFPVIGLVQVGEQAMADRYMYVPLIGLIFFAVWGLHEATARLNFRRPLLIALAAVTLALCSFQTWNQLRVWKDTKSIFEHAFAVTSKNYLAATIYGAQLMVEGDNERATQMFNDALQWKPGYPEAHMGLGNVFINADKVDEAIPHFQAALGLRRTNPNASIGLGIAHLRKKSYAQAEEAFRHAISFEPFIAAAHLNLGIVLHRQGRFEEANQSFLRAVELEPNSIAILSNVATAFAEQNKDEAAVYFSRAISCNPKNPELYAQYAAFLDSRSRFREAAAQYREALQIDPKSVQVLNNLAWLLATCVDDSVRNGTEAVTLAERACELTENKIPVLLGTLAAACAEAGRFPDAVQKATRARELALAQNDSVVAEKNEKLIELYRAGKTARELK